MNAQLLVLLAASAVLVGGCQTAEKKAPVNESATPGAERKTMEFVQRSHSDLAEHMALWAREGWLVHSIITVTQVDGTVLRRADLSRPKSASVPPQ